MGATMTPTGRRPSQPELQRICPNVVHSWDVARHNVQFTTDFSDLELRLAACYDPDDAMHRECVPLDEADDEDPLRFLAHDGIDHTTGLDSLFQDHHAGVMISAGFAMLENDDDC